MSKASPSPLFFNRQQSNAGDGVSSETSWVPNTDVYSTDAGLVVSVELAGMRREDLELAVVGNRLKISGNRSDESRGVKPKFLVMEINYGSFESVIDLPEGCDMGKARAIYQNGFLRIEIPASSKSYRKRKIPVSSDD